ncbi:MAG TPA: GNAT family N-acetyltransferase, partial [Nitrososphaeraceae archaeon]
MITTTKFRLATHHDKDYVLDLCKNTFSWGDYIDRVWDIWIREPNSIFLVAVNENNIDKPIGIAHGVLIPQQMVWVEGIRVDPKYRAQKLATNMYLHILDYARKKGALYSSAIVSINNDPSKGLMDKLGFKMISKWTYISIKPIVFPDLDNAIADNSKVAILSEYQQILNFLNQPDIFKLSRKKFVNSWRWHDLTEDRLKKMINNKQVIIFDNKYYNNNDYVDDDKKENKIKGIAIIDKEGYWNNPNIFQIIYIHAYSDEILLSLVLKCLELISFKENKYERVQIFTPSPIKDNSLLFQKFNINFSEQ